MTSTHPERLAALIQSASETLENLAFTEVVPAPESDPEELGGKSVPAARYLGSLALEGEGRMGIAIDRDFLEDLTRTLFSGSGDMGEPLIGDALREILNIIGGRYLAALHGDGRDFRMGLPELLEAESPDWHSAATRCRLLREEGGGLSLFVNPA